MLTALFSFKPRVFSTDNDSDCFVGINAMRYVVRDTKGSIVSLHREEVPGAEVLPLSHPDIQAFLTGTDGKSFAMMDADLVRVLEDLIDVLLRRNVFRITDLPLEAQVKLFERKHFRENLQTHALNLFTDQQAQVTGGQGAQSSFGGLSGLADPQVQTPLSDLVPMAWHDSDFKV